MFAFNPCHRRAGGVLILCMAIVVWGGCSDIVCTVIFFWFCCERGSGGYRTTLLYDCSSIMSDWGEVGSDTLGFTVRK